ncbi:hypothetical protein [Bradyrhizobium sp. CCBAU 51753]|uniref:hypothetical protein n=1 Tax=Bradyrhizobium sp. CCBAU 51753 TaxID=1325100 RepID=UPI00188B2F10|nr:hypothetical protein [Bradyrhizobium sp. CCBAU 51753]QOZ25123.1 hypothetical protein XH93_17115 [Bradyrhizobium sp. CCBAU 51753]
MRPNTGPSSISLIVRSYVTELRQWIGRLVTGYALACGFMLVGAAFVLVAAGVGVAAAFHAIELHYGIRIAYAAIGGGFLLLGLSGLVMGQMLFKRPAPPLPRPTRQADMLKRSIAVPVAARLIAGSRAAGGVDTTTRALAAAAAVMLVGWVAASRLRRKPDAVED